MNTATKPSAFVAAVTACALLFQFGACVFSTKPQEIPVTSNPVGAKINVDGQDAGTTPLTLSLKREEDHRIRIEKPGYDPVDILLVSKSSTSGRRSHLWGGLLLIPLMAVLGAAMGYLVGDASRHKTHEATGFWIGALAGAGLVLASTASSAKALLTPSVINVTLEKTQTSAPARTKVVLLDRDQLKDIRWIRISCAEGGAEDVVAVN